MKRYLTLFIGFFLLLIFEEINAQENNYWSIHQGAKAALNGSAVLAKNENYSASYYNPGILPFIKDNSVSLSVVTYFANTINLENGAGENMPLKQTYLEAVPQNLFGIIQVSKDQKWVFSYAILNTLYSNISLNTKTEKKGDYSLVNPGDEYYLGSYNYSNRMREDWYGFAAGYKVNSRFGIGLGLYGVIKNIRLNQTMNANVIDYNRNNQISNTLASSYSNETLNYFSFGLLTKVGFNYNLEKLKFGFTITTPLLNTNFFGQAWINRSLLYNGLDATNNDVNQLSFQEKINTINKKPWVFDFGATYTFSKTELSVRLAHYTAIDKYNLLNAADFDTSSVFDQIEAFGVPQLANKSVTNIGLGVIQNITKKTDLYLGFNTDYNNFDATNFDRYKDFVPTISNWDFYHYAAGLSHKLTFFELSYGLSFMHSNTLNEQQLVNLSQPTEEYYLFGEPTYTMNSKVARFNLHVGFTYYF
ncbi:hypothetical protein [Flavicella marina]|uniref:hypothetical protein n=1 Tax=Flavicella marina TaxID=1475951 RepID=UPI001264C451|nr:hypothetical protein [Flavicella marina]